MEWASPIRSPHIRFLLPVLNHLRVAGRTAAERLRALFRNTATPSGATERRFTHRWRDHPRGGCDGPGRAGEIPSVGSARGRLPAQLLIGEPRWCGPSAVQSTWRTILIRHRAAPHLRMRHRAEVDHVSSACAAIRWRPGPRDGLSIAGSMLKPAAVTLLVGVRARWLQSPGGADLFRAAARVPGCGSFGRRGRRAPTGGFRDGVSWQQVVAGFGCGGNHRKATGTER